MVHGLQVVVVNKNQVSEEKSFSMILRIEIILSVVSHERKKIIIFYEEKFERESIIILMFFVIELFFADAFINFFKMADF